MTQIGETNFSTDLGNYNLSSGTAGIYTPPLPELQPDTYAGSQKKKSKLPWIIGGLTVVGGLLLAYKKPEYLKNQWKNIKNWLKIGAKDAKNEVTSKVDDVAKEGGNKANEVIKKTKQSTFSDFENVANGADIELIQMVSGKSGATYDKAFAKFSEKKPEEIMQMIKPYLDDTGKQVAGERPSSIINAAIDAIKTKGNPKQVEELLKPYAEGNSYSFKVKNTLSSILGNPTQNVVEKQGFNARDLLKNASEDIGV